MLISVMSKEEVYVCHSRVGKLYFLLPCLF